MASVYIFFKGSTAVQECCVVNRREPSHCVSELFASCVVISVLVVLFFSYVAGRLSRHNAFLRCYRLSVTFSQTTLQNFLTNPSHKRRYA